MPGYAAFLRGVNLGPHRRISNAQLRALFEEECGFTGVGPFRSSGNVVFECDHSGAARLTSLIEERLSASLGFDVKIFLRTGEELRAIAAHEPFPAKQVAASKGKLQVDLLEKSPSASLRKRVLALATDVDPLAFGERELYWLPSGGQMESELDLQAIQKLTGPTTRRTMGTIEQMASKYFGG